MPGKRRTGVRIPALSLDLSEPPFPLRRKEGVHTPHRAQDRLTDKRLVWLLTEWPRVLTSVTAETLEFPDEVG